ncbi:DUF1905 domain-containing protein [Schumannella sp. 10F1B-5-1]|uniref:DUF1905 domain-containing protein n=1 Tax=Schumannella sp. 10F1B-5-1 TaxID=2590780 RepID=UPI0011312FBD|nr:DUF1905 domain-containing protein [Schumannella sp. 10F1B-5-1]TPW73076.1 DUF1905 domain-containing protein [Schumannella sp. 10F1B-5-1]
MQLAFSGDLWFWRGPSPFHFVTVPPAEAAAIGEVAGAVSYGWGMIPVTAHLDRDGRTTTWATSLWPKDGAYIVPVKKVVQDAHDLDLGDVLDLRLDIAT